MDDAAAVDAAGTGAIRYIDHATDIGPFIDYWIIGMSIVVAIMFVRYTLNPKYFGVGDNPHKNETLAMPRGTLRGILTLSLLAIILKLEASGLSGKGVVIAGKLTYAEDSYKELTVAFQMMLAFYFGAKVVHHVTNADKQKTQAISQSLVQSKSASGPTPRGRARVDDFEDPEARG